MVSLIAYAGNLGMDSGPSQSVYELDTTAMHRLTASPQVLRPGQSLKLPTAGARSRSPATSPG
jgi:hypothetical protein